MVAVNCCGFPVHEDWLLRVAVVVFSSGHPEAIFVVCVRGSHAGRDQGTGQDVGLSRAGLSRVMSCWKVIWIERKLL